MTTPALTLLLLVLFGIGRPGQAGAQCLSLRDLIALSTTPTALTAPEKLPELPAADWKFEGPVPNSQDIYWTSTSKNGNGLPKATLTLRPMQQLVDAVLKTTDPACIRQVRAELKELNRPFVLVNCPGGCEAQRYESTAVQTTLYSRMPGDYPFVLVMHPRAAPLVPAAAPKPSVRTSAQ